MIDLENNNAAVYRDIYRDAFGCRPRGTIWTDFLAMSEAEQAEELRRVGELADAETEREQAGQRAAAERFEARVAETIAMGAGNRETAIRWIVEAEGADYYGDAGYAEFCLNLPYGYLTRQEAA